MNVLTLGYARHSIGDKKGVSRVLESDRRAHGGPGGGSRHAFQLLARSEMPAITSTAGLSAVPAFAAW